MIISVVEEYNMQEGNHWEVYNFEGALLILEEDGLNQANLEKEVCLVNLNIIPKEVVGNIKAHNIQYPWALTGKLY